MKLITKEIMNKLKRAGARPDTIIGNNLKPWLKLFNPVVAQTWLIAGIAEDGDTMYGLCDLGFGCPELGYVSLNEIKNLDLPFGLKIERDINFIPDKSLTQYAKDARSIGSIR